MAKKKKQTSATDKEWQVGDSAEGVRESEIERIRKLPESERSGAQQSVVDDANDLYAEREDHPSGSGAEVAAAKNQDLGFSPDDMPPLDNSVRPGRVISDAKAGYDQAAYDAEADSGESDDPRTAEIFAKPMKSWTKDELDYAMEARDMSKEELEQESRGEIDGDDPEWRNNRNKAREDGFTKGPSGNRGPASLVDSLIPSAAAADELPLGAQQLKALKEDGYTPSQIAEWRKDAEKAFQEDGYPEDAIRDYFGDPKFDEAPVKEYFKSNPDWHAPMVNAPAYTGKDKAPPVQKPPKEAKGLLDAFGAGFKATGVGMIANQGLPDTVLGEKATILEKLAEGAGQIAGDAAPMIGGAVLGTLGAGPVAGWFIGGAVPAGMRKMLVDKYTKGEVKSAQEFWDRTQETFAAMGEGGIINTLTMGAGAGASSAAGRVLGKVALKEVSKTAIKTGAALTAETLAMGSAPKALNGELPEPEDFAHAATVILGMHAIGSGVRNVTGAAMSKRADAIEARASGKVKSKLDTAYVETGLTPPEVTEMARRDPLLAQELISNEPGLPDSLQSYKDVNGRPDFVETPKVEITETVPAEFGGGEISTTIEVRDPTQNQSYKYEPMDVTRPTEGKVFYHGTKGALEKLSDADVYGQSSVKNLYGEGLYLTDNPEVAKSYSENKGKGPPGKVLAAKLNNLNLIDLEGPMPEPARAIINKYLGYYDAPPIAPTAKGRLGYEMLKDAFRDSELTHSDVIEIYQNINSELSTAGYDGLRHEGGGRFGAKYEKGPHNVAILFEDIATQDGKIVGRHLKDKFTDLDLPKEMPPPETVSKEATPREAFKNATPERQAEISAEASFNFVKSGIGEPPSDGPVIKTKRFLTEGGLREHIINKYDPLTQFVREVTGAKSQQGAIDAMPASESAVLLTGLFNGQVGKALRAIESDTISYKTGETTGEGLIPILKVVEQSKLQKLKNKIPGLKDKEYRPTVEDFDAYVFAKHAKEVAEKYDHVTGLEKNAAATKNVIEIGDRVYKDAAKRFVDFQNRGLQYLADSGVKSKEEAAKMIAKYEHYIPLEKIIVGDGPGSISKSLNPKQILKKRGKGSAEQIYSPTLRAAERVHEYYMMAEKNRVTKSIHDLMVKYEYPVKEVKPDPGFKMEIMDENGKSTGEFASVYRELKNNELAFFEEGVRKVFDVPENVANTIKAMGIDKTNKLTSVLSIPAKLLRLGVTIPIDFMLKNMFRDQFHAFTQSRGNYVPYVTYVEGLANIAAKSKKYRDYQSFGAMNSSSVSLDINYSGQSLARIADKTSMRDAAFNVVSSPIKAMQVGIEMLQKFSDLAETGTRVGEYSKVYDKLRKQGLSHQDAGLKAAFAARNVTVDFQRMGASMKAFNMVVPFLNPNIQGTAQIFTNIQERRYDVALKMGALTAAAAGLWALNKDDPRMKEVPQWQKDIFYIIPMDEWVPSIYAEKGNPNTRLVDGRWETNIGKIIRLPKPQGMIAGSSQSIEAYLDYLHSQDPDKGEILRKEILKAFLPDTPVNPTAFSVPMQLRTNYDTYRDKQLVPWYIEESRLPHRRFTKQTSSAAKFLSEKLFELGVDTDNIPAPAKTDFAVTGLLGSTGRTALDVAGYALDKMAGRTPILGEKEWDDLPFVRSFTIRMPDQSEAVNEYYNLKKDHDTWVKDTAAAAKAKDNTWMLQNQGRKEFLVMNEMKKDFGQADGRMKAIKSQIEKVEALPESVMSKTEKSRTVDAYMWTRIKVARELIQKNKAIEHSVSEYWKTRK